MDTLEQELCIKDNEKCPLYDAGIGNKSNDENYIYNETFNVYYNNENYNKENKSIIGKLILNEGQPCYNSNEKLWRQFYFEEAGKTHLKCDIEIFGKWLELVGKLLENVWKMIGKWMSFGKNYQTPRFS